MDEKKRKDKYWEQRCIPTYYCRYCDYKTIKIDNYYKHNETRKHKIAIEEDRMLMKISELYQSINKKKL